MATTFTREDATTCFRCDSKPPSFRLISLESFPTEDGALEPDCLAGLFCEECLRIEVDGLCESFAQSRIPLGADESSKGFLARQIGFIVVPILFSQRESELMFEELATDGIETAVN
jgi:hypothetical protein